MLEKSEPPKPMQTDDKFDPGITFFDKLIWTKKEKKIKQADYFYKKALEDWEKKKEQIQDDNKKLQEHFEKILKKWLSSEEKFYKHQAENEKKFLERRAKK